MRESNESVPDPPQDLRVSTDISYRAAKSAFELPGSVILVGLPCAPEVEPNRAMLFCEQHRSPDQPFIRVQPFTLWR